ncbi:MAG: hypothetical protein IKP36_05270 [Bacteroidaceae bacterium]|nr:hypothetical protein [Bacteroidaceae bacterium]
MKVEIRIEGVIEVDDNVTEEQIQEAVEFAVGLNGQMAIDNPVGYDIEWDKGDVEIRIKED